ncbi:MAG: DUF5908 family protein [Ferruginibacter sp.]
MPVQINEMIIRANIMETDEKKGESQPDAGGSTGGNKDDIVKECVAMVLEILNNKNQR